MLLQGVEGFLLRQLVDLAYGRPFEAERAADLLGPSSMLQFTAVEQLCVDALKRTVADDTAAPLLELADALSQVLFTLAFTSELVSRNIESSKKTKWLIFTFRLCAFFYDTRKT